MYENLKSGAEIIEEIRNVLSADFKRTEFILWPMISKEEMIRLLINRAADLGYPKLRVNMQTVYDPGMRCNPTQPPSAEELGITLLMQPPPRKVEQKSREAVPPLDEPDPWEMVQIELLKLRDEMEPADAEYASSLDPEACAARSRMIRRQAWRTCAETLLRLGPDLSPESCKLLASILSRRGTLPPQQFEIDLVNFLYGPDSKIHPSLVRPAPVLLLRQARRDDMFTGEDKTRSGLAESQRLRLQACMSESLLLQLQAASPDPVWFPIRCRLRNDTTHDFIRWNEVHASDLLEPLHPGEPAAVLEITAARPGSAGLLVQSWIVAIAEDEDGFRVVSRISNADIPLEVWHASTPEDLVSSIRAQMDRGNPAP